MRIVLITMAPPVAHRLTELLRGLGHDVPGVVMMRNRRRPQLLAEFMLDPPEQLDVVVASAPARLAPLLRSFEPDVALCSGFGWRIPADALAVPPLGIVNGHPSVLPKYRGPNPFGWTFRNGDDELGFTFHLMDADFDTGPILAQGTMPLTDDDSARDIAELLPPLVTELLPRALARVGAGDRGDPQQDDGASYAPTFEDEYVEIDWTRPARFVHNQTRAWFVPSESGLLGPLTTLDGTRVRVLRTRLVADGATGAAPGTVLAREDGELLVQCGDRPIRVLRTEPA
jgi:methionyl-tRNA formyltransferase